MKKIKNIVKEYFPDVNDDFVEFVVWEKTGYPEFWRIPEDGNTPEECFRKQLKDYKNEMDNKKTD